VTPVLQTTLVAAFIVLSTVLQGRVAHAVSLHGITPDFGLVTLACGATLVGGTRSVGLGFWAGLLMAALVPGTPGTFLVSRTFAGAFAGWLHGSVIRDSVLVPPFVGLTVTLIAELVYVLMAPTHHLRAWAVTRGGEIVYNALLALPVYGLMRRLRIGAERDDPFALHG
jgi:hypothetical protein